MNGMTSLLCDRWRAHSRSTQKESSILSVPAVPPARGGEVLMENATPTAVPPVPPARGGEVLMENATPTAVPPVRGGRGAA